MLRTLIYSEFLRILVLFFAGIVLQVTDLEFSEIFGNSKKKEKRKKFLTPFCLERNAEQSCVFSKIFKISENFRIFEKHTEFLSIHNGMVLRFLFLFFILFYI